MTQPKTDKAAAGILELQKVFSRLSPDERDRLLRAGVTIPEGDISAIATGDYRFGLRCRKCNHVALYFIGTEWTIRGQKVDLPPALPHWEIAWTQSLPPSQIDRHEPRCQECGATVPLQQSGAFDFGNELMNSVTGTGRSRLVIVPDFEASRDKAFDRKNVAAYKRQRDQGPGQLESVAGNVSSDYTLKPKPASEIIDAKFGPGTSEQLEQVAHETGVAAYTPKAG